MKLRDASHKISVIERNKVDDTLRGALLFSDEALDILALNDPVSARASRQHFACWDDMAVIRDDEKIVSSGHGFCSIRRKQLLILLQRKTRELGVNLCFETPVEDIDQYQTEYDLVIAFDDLRSPTRINYQAHFKPDIDVRDCKFIWYATWQKFNHASRLFLDLQIKVGHGHMPINLIISTRLLS
jgi:anthraniloyl-CoA monooxygenase